MSGHRKMTILTIVLTCTAFTAAIACSKSWADELGADELGVDELARFTHWTHFAIAEKLPGTAWGTGGIGVADFDGNGSADIAVSRRETKTAYWFERKDDATWIRHDIGTDDHLVRTLGAAALDIDQDGLTDVAFWGVWFQNPGKLAAADMTQSSSMPITTVIWTSSPRSGTLTVRHITWTSGEMISGLDLSSRAQSGGFRPRLMIIGKPDAASQTTTLVVHDRGQCR